MKKTTLFFCLSILCLFLHCGCEKLSNSEQTTITNDKQTIKMNNEQAVKTLKSLEAMMATIEVMDKHNPFQLPYPGLGDPSYYQKMKLNYGSSAESVVEVGFRQLAKLMI